MLILLFCSKTCLKPFNWNVSTPAESQRKPPRSISAHLSSQSLNSLQDSYDKERGEEFHTQVDRENSFEDLEQFLTQLDWAPPLENTEDTGSHLELHCDQPLPLEQDEVHIQELETRALTEHLKAIVKEIHVAIGERHRNLGFKQYHVATLMPRCWWHLFCVEHWSGLCVPEQLLSLCLLSFESLNTAASKDLCLACIEEAFFTPLWSALVALFRYCCRNALLKIIFM